MEDAARRYLEDPAAMSCPWVESPFFERLLERADLSESDRALARKFHDDGYVVLEDLIDVELVDRVAAEYPRLFDPANEFRDAPRKVRPLLRRDTTRKQDAHWVSPPCTSSRATDRCCASSGCSTAARRSPSRR
jgi:hypothetical protein